MFGSEMIEVALGLIFVFMIASLLVSTIRETIEAKLKTRAIHLELGIRQMLDDPTGSGLTKDLFNHSLLFGLFAGSYDPAKQHTDFIAAKFKTYVGSGIKAAGSVVHKLLTGKESTTGEPVTPVQRLGMGSNLPNYVPSRNFAMALLDLIGGSGTNAGVLSIQSVTESVLKMPDSRIKQALLVALAEGGDDLDRVRTSLEAWFDGTMDRVSGWYKRETQNILLVMGFLVAALLNIDALGIAYDLSRNNTQRQALIAHVDAAFPQIRTSPELKLTKEQLDAQINGLSNVIGWTRLANRLDEKFNRKLKEYNDNLSTLNGEALKEYQRAHARPSHFEMFVPHIAGRIPGWIITAFAISLGAPFWFDVLNKVMVIRSTVKPYEKSPPEGSEDRKGGVSSASQLAPRSGGVSKR